MRQINEGIILSTELTYVAASRDATTRAMVLLVDDQALVGEVIRRILLADDCIDFHFCSNPDKAVEMALTIKPTVILQDLVMPGVNGLDLVKQYKAHEQLVDLPIIVLSAKDDPAIKSMAFEAGANDYLVKLPDAIELIARIRYHSKAFNALRQRDEIYRALRISQQQLQESNLALEKLMRTDGLTELANRRHFDESIETEWKRAAREHSNLSLLMIDADYFKTFNDSFGHVQGDYALQKIAQVIKQHCERAGDLAARYGGEEFAAIFPSTDLAGATLLAEKICRAIQNLAIPHNKPTLGSVVTVSIGVASALPQTGLEPTKLLEWADKALYKAKHNGRNRVECHTLEQ